MKIYNNTIFNKLFMTTSVIAMLLVSSQVFAFTNYVSLSAGAILPDQANSIGTRSSDKGLAVNGAYGIDLDNTVRLEAEVGYRQVSPSNAFSLLLNGWYDFTNDTRFTPYLGGGVGLSRGVAYQAGGGIAYSLHPKFALDLGYRYFGVSSSSSKKAAVDIAGSTLLIGARLKFQ